VAFVKFTPLKVTLAEVSIFCGMENTNCPVEVDTVIWFVVPVAMTAPVRLLSEETPPAEVDVTYLFPPAS